jgi:hypothetical protein
MPVKVEYEQFRFAKAMFNKPGNVARRYDSDFVWAANEIVRELQRVGWDVPAAEATIHYYGRGANIMKYCSEVVFDVDLPDGTKEKAHIRYSNSTGSSVGRWSRLGSASGLRIGEKELNLYSDGSGDWKKLDRLKWGVASIMPLLHALQALPAKEGFDEEHVEGDRNLREICSFQPTPVPDGFPVLYTWVESRDAHNALGISDCYGDSAENQDYRLVGNGWRFANTDYGVKWGELPPGANDGYNFASADIGERPHGLCMSSESGILPVEVTLKYLDDIYVADLAPYEQAREDGFKLGRAEGRDEFSWAEIGDQRRATIATFVPASEYKGGYAKPVYMIGRQLGADEARGMAGQVYVAVEDGFTVAKMIDRTSDRDVILYEGGSDLYHKIRAVEAGNEVARIFQREAKVSSGVSGAIEAHRAKLREDHAGDKSMALLLG